MAEITPPKNHKVKVHQRKKKVDNINFRNQVESYTLRPEQEKVLEWIKKPMKEGKKFFILEMPTGVGKSIWANAFMYYYDKEVNSKAKFDILTNSKILQKQYFKEFQYMNNLWGRNNYRCEKWENSCEYGKQCNNGKKAKCEECPYTEAYKDWADGKISLTNFHIHGLFSLFAPTLLEERNADVLIVDEAHLLEETINGFVSFTLSKKNWKGYVSDAKSGQWEEDLATFDLLEDVVKWIDVEFQPGLKNALNDMYKRFPKAKGKAKESITRQISNIERTQVTVHKFMTDYKSNKSEWVADRKLEKGEISWSIQPLWTDKIMSESIWGNYKHVILMSGTIIDSNVFCEVNGIEKDQVASVKMDSPFPLQNRPIYYLPTGKLSFKEKQKNWAGFVPVIKKLLKKYKGKKGIIHTGNYELWSWIKRDIEDDRLIFASPEDREFSLEEHLNSDEDTVIVSPSMMYGIDLKDDYSRFQIIVKMPYPSLASKVNKQRNVSKPMWYSWRTVMDIIQSYGRSVRNLKDYADTIILDSAFSNIMSFNSAMLPKYFKDAIKRKN